MEIQEKYIENVLNAVNETDKLDALFELKHEYLRLKGLARCKR